jgi:glutamate formiminotransferase / 5-formyltetrahydrofolate cyclo-ligase
MAIPKIVECVPNFSEGRQPEVVEQIVKAIAATPDVRVLRSESDTDHNRSVVTVVGEPAALCEAVLQGCIVAIDLIDMNTHDGVHPCIGAADVIPFVPISGVTDSDCIALAHQLAIQLAEQVELPVYMYGRAASDSARSNLADIRRCGYAGLASRITTHPFWQPDYGPPFPHASAGASAVGVRGPLIAFNIDIDTDDIKVAKRIAAKIRESNAGLAGVKALGLFLKDRGVAQVSMNITDVQATSLAMVYDRVSALALTEDVEILRSELIGMAGLQPVLDVAAHYLKMDMLGSDRILSDPGQGG